MYALIVNNTATTVQGTLPDAARRQDTQDWVLGLPNATVALQQACGWFAVTDVARPADTATKTTDRSIQNIGGTWTVVWTQRDQTADELASTTANTNRATITTAAGNALSANQTYLAIASPSAAQVAAQVRALTQQMDGAIRLLINRLDATT